MSIVNFEVSSLKTILKIQRLDHSQCKHEIESHQAKWNDKITKLRIESLKAEDLKNEP